MQFIIGALGWLVSRIASSGSRATAEFIAFRALYLFLIVTVLPFVLVKLGTGLASRVYDFAYTQLGTVGDGTMTGFVIQGTGLMGWLLDCFQVPYCFTLIMTAYSVRYSIKFFKLLLVWK
jgi:phosphotransferase system  glucose/maltose/N-acetylglucosamine-specific IIC component